MLPAKFPQQAPVEPKVNPQPLGNREDKLAVRHCRAHLLAHPTAVELSQAPFRFRSPLALALARNLDLLRDLQSKIKSKIKSKRRPPILNSTAVLAHPERRLQGPFLMATGTNSATATGKGHEKLAGTFRTADPGQAVLRIAAFEELFDRRGAGRTPKAVALLISLFIGRLKLRVKPLHQLLKRCLLRLARPIKTASFVFTAHKAG